MMVTDALHVPSIAVPENDLESAESTVWFEGTARAHARVMVYDGKVALGLAVADGEGRWLFEPEEPLAKREHIIVVRTTDGTWVSRPSMPRRVVVTGGRLPVTGGAWPGGHSRSTWLSLVLGLLLVGACLAETLRSPRRAGRQ
jgi:hypothetical protein